MTFSEGGALQIAVADRLVAELATAAPDGGAIAVFDHAPDDTGPAHVRIEAQSFVPDRFKDRTPGRHIFSIRYFDGDGSEDNPVRGQMDVRRVGDLIVAALSHWRPLVGGSQINLLGADIQPGNGASGFEFRARFTYPTN